MPDFKAIYFKSDFWTGTLINLKILSDLFETYK
jgi:hypothetical protein